MKLKLIKTKKDYQAALNRLEAIFDAKTGTNEGDELEVAQVQRCGEALDDKAGGEFGGGHGIGCEKRQMRRGSAASAL